jgi:hypothetical protein
MIILVVLFGGFFIPYFAAWMHDPAPGFFRPAADSRGMECRFFTDEGAREIRSETNDSSAGRGDFAEMSAMRCNSFVMNPGERSNAQEAVLWDLSRQVADITSTISRSPEAEGQTWLVDVYHPDAELAAKIRTAVRVALAERNVHVTDRVPVLPAEDIQNLQKVSADSVMPFACSRFSKQQALSSKDTLLGVVLRDNNETLLHAGTCKGGEWVWLL